MLGASRRLGGGWLRRSLFAPAAMLVLMLVLPPAGRGHAEQARSPSPSTAAAKIADFFQQVGDQVYEHCIFDLSQEQIEVQQALIGAYVKQGASSAIARQLAAKQIQPPPVSDECRQIKSEPEALPPFDVTVTPTKKEPKKEPKVAALPKPKAAPATPVPSPPISLANKTTLPQWDCGSGVDYVTIQHRGYERKLTGGEICNPFEDVVHEVPASLKRFRLGYTITTGRLFVVSDDPQASGKTIAWAISGREVCRNNPDPDCLATRAVGPLPPGKYSFGSGKRVTWGPNIKRMVAGIYLTKLWNRDRFTRAQTRAILKRSNIAIHVRLKGEMSEACLGLEPKGWAYVSALISEGRATGVDVHIDEPYSQIAEAPPVVTGSSFSLSSLFK
jgi:hypothetical protein